MKEGRKEMKGRKRGKEGMKEGKKTFEAVSALLFGLYFDWREGRVEEAYMKEGACKNEHIVRND